MWAPFSRASTQAANRLSLSDNSITRRASAMNARGVLDRITGLILSYVSVDSVIAVYSQFVRRANLPTESTFHNAAPDVVIAESVCQSAVRSGTGNPNLLQRRVRRVEDGVVRPICGSSESPVRQEKFSVV